MPAYSPLGHPGSLSLWGTPTAPVLAVAGIYFACTIYRAAYWWLTMLLPVVAAYYLPNWKAISGRCMLRDLESFAGCGLRIPLVSTPLNPAGAAAAGSYDRRA